MYIYWYIFAVIEIYQSVGKLVMKLLKVKCRPWRSPRCHNSPWLHVGSKLLLGTWQSHVETTWHSMARGYHDATYTLTANLWYLCKLPCLTTVSPFSPNTSKARSFRTLEPLSRVQSILHERRMAPRVSEDKKTLSAEYWENFPCQRRIEMNRILL